MNPLTPRRSFLKSAATLVALALPLVGLAQPAATVAPASVTAAATGGKTHTITITFANGVWGYFVSPAQPNGKQVKVKRGDRLNWISSDGHWTVFFKNGTTPLEDGGGNPMSAVSSATGQTNGGSVAAKHPSGASFTYGVRLQLNGSGATVEDDPEIIIE